MGKGFALLLVLVLLTTITLSVVCIQPVNAQTVSAVTINVDGTVTPSEAPIEQIGNIYSLTRDFVGSITVNRSNIIVDGKNYALSGGLLIREVSNVTVKEFVVTDGKDFVANQIDGILLDHAFQVIVTNNTISGIWSIQALNGVGFCGIDVYAGDSNIITKNNLIDNMCGLTFYNTAHNLIVQNNVMGDKSLNSMGIQFISASNNTIYHNNFVNNGFAFHNLNSLNVYDNGYPSGGNFWSDYSTSYYNIKEIDGSGIGNVSYVMHNWYWESNSTNIDRYPLLEPFNATFNEIVTAPPRITMTSPLDQKYNESEVPLVFTVDRAVNWIGYRLDNQPNVTIVGNSSIVNLTYGSHNVTVYANSTFGILGTSENVSFTITEPFPTMTVVAVSGVVAVLVVAGLLVYIKKHKHGLVKKV